MLFKMHKIIFFTRNKKKTCVPIVPKIFRLMFYSIIYEACIGGLPVSYIPGSKQESIPYPFK